MNLPNLKPPRLPPEEHLRRLRLQAEGVQHWPDDADKMHMLVWLDGQIAQWKLIVEKAQAGRS